MPWTSFEYHIFLLQNFASSSPSERRIFSAPKFSIFNILWASHFFGSKKLHNQYPLEVTFFFNSNFYTCNILWISHFFLMKNLHLYHPLIVKFSPGPKFWTFNILWMTQFCDFKVLHNQHLLNVIFFFLLKISHLHQVVGIQHVFKTSNRSYCKKKTDHKSLNKKQKQNSFDNKWYIFFQITSWGRFNAWIRHRYCLKKKAMEIFRTCEMFTAGDFFVLNLLTLKWPGVLWPFFPYHRFLLFFFGMLLKVRNLSLLAKVPVHQTACKLELWDQLTSSHHYVQVFRSFTSWFLVKYLKSYLDFHKTSKKGIKT